jgi:hypothetical protein
MRTHISHTTWCARGHSCGLDEHRAKPITITVQSVGCAVLTRVAARDGREYAEIRLRLALPRNEPDARVRLTALLTRLPQLLAGVRGARCA